MISCGLVVPRGGSGALGATPVVRPSPPHSLSPPPPQEGGLDALQKAPAGENFPENPIKWLIAGHVLVI